jgi:hypothetical protein
MRSALATIAAMSVTACSQPVANADDLQLSAHTVASADSVTVITTVTNAGLRRVQRSIGGGCPVTIAAYAAENPATGVPVWDQGEWRRQSNVACAYSLAQLSLSPGESKEYRASAAIRDVLGDSLPAGTYSFLARASFEQGVVSVPAGEATLDADPR